MIQKKNQLEDDEEYIPMNQHRKKKMNPQIPSFFKKKKALARKEESFKQRK